MIFQHCDESGATGSQLGLDKCLNTRLVLGNSKDFLWYMTGVRSNELWSIGLSRAVSAHRAGLDRAVSAHPLFEQSSPLPVKLSPSVT